MLEMCDVVPLFLASLMDVTSLLCLLNYIWWRLINVGILMVLLCFLFTYSSRFGYGVGLLAGACSPCVVVVNLFRFFRNFGTCPPLVLLLYISIYAIE